MTQDQINFAFEGRWRVKGNFGQINAARACMSTEEFYDYIKDMCRDFFEAGILLGEGFRTDEITFPNGMKGSIPYKKDLDVDTLDGGFSIFWNLYEKKVGRPKCEKLWSKLTIKEREECIAYIPLYKKAQPDKQYRKNPETFLRNKSWNDELIFRENGNKPNDNQQRLEKLSDILTT